MQNKRENRWHEIRGTQKPAPRVWLHCAGQHYQLSWAMISQIKASEDFLSIQFLCKIGLVELSSSTSMRELFLYLLDEKVWKIEGDLLACKITPLE